jgi:hypothetical protein
MILLYGWELSMHPLKNFKNLKSIDIHSLVLVIEKDRFGERFSHRTVKLKPLTVR